MTLSTAVRPRWLFRVASAPEAGGGHMARCLSLAHAMALQADVVFALDPNGEGWLGPVHRAGFNGTTVEADIPAGPWAGVLVDSYRIANPEAADLKKIVGSGSLVAIDDLSQPLAAADLIINSGCHLDGSFLNGKPALLGPRYALLDTAFRAIPSHPIRHEIGIVLVSFGRLDSKNATAIALAGLALLLEQGMDFRTEVTLGAAALHRAAVEKAIHDFPGQVELAIDADDIPDRLARADLAIGGGGVSLLERLAAGVPSVTVVQAANQAASAAGAALHGATIDAGPIAEADPAKLAALLSRLMGDHPLRVRLAQAGRNMVDGRGAERVAEQIARHPKPPHQIN